MRQSREKEERKAAYRKVSYVKWPTREETLSSYSYSRMRMVYNSTQYTQSFLILRREGYECTQPLYEKYIVQMKISGLQADSLEQ
jgi:hypothetical protein